MHNKTKKFLASSVAVLMLTAGLPAIAASPAMLIPFTQATLADAQSLLQEAIARLERAKAEGGDVGAAEAEVEAARVAVEALKLAEAQAAAEAEAAAKAAADAEAQKAAEAEAANKAAAAEAAAKAQAEAEAKAEAEAEAAAKAAAVAEAQKAAEAEAAAKATEEDAANKAAEAEAEAKAQAEADAKAAAEAEAAAKAAAEAEAQKAAEAEAAAKAAEEDAANKADEPKPDPAKPVPEPELPAPAPSNPAQPEKPVPTDPVPAAPQPEQPAPADPAPTAPQPELPAPSDPAPQPEQPAPADPVPATPQPDQPAPTEPAPAEPVPASAPDPILEKLPEPLPENAAPVLDSAKEELPPPVKKRSDPDQPDPKPDPALQTPAPPPATDAQAQVNVVPVEVISAVREQGERVTELPKLVTPPQEEVLQVIDNRMIINIGTQIIVNTSDSPRLAEDDDEVIIERLPRGRTRETIIRENGVQVVTIRNRYGDVIQRSRILPDGREVILAYAPEYDTDSEYVWRDPSYDLPPLRLNVPIREYILSVSLIEDQPEQYDEEEIYYEFLDKPPVERVERIYSVDDVKRSARVRDMVRRIDLDTLTFGFGSSEIKEDQIEKLESVANAILKLLEKNPAETFLIEGHTDAVGTDRANLILSDKRAEAIAEALSGAFGVPPENMTTQGYGERYLKVKTQKPEELNRRVAIRRITSLVAPVAQK